MLNPPRPQCQNKREQKLYHFSSSNYNIFLSYYEGHPINLKERFLFAHIKIFGNNKMFQKDLFSTDCLNQEAEWGRSFFASLIENFERFSIREKDESNGESIIFCIGKNKEIALNTVLELDFGANIEKCFWGELENYLNSRNEEIDQINSENSDNEKEKLESIRNLNEFTLKQEAKMKILKGNLSILMTEKVNKLREFEEDYKIELFEEKLEKIKEQKFMSSYQEENEFNASLFQPSQDFR